MGYSGELGMFYSTFINSVSAAQDSTIEDIFTWYMDDVGDIPQPINAS